MEQRQKFSGRGRLMTASGALLGAAVLTSSAYFTDFTDLEGQVSGARNSFGIVIAGSADPAWSIAHADWSDADASPLVVDLGAGAALGPGVTRTLRMAAKNTSPRLDSTLKLEVRDPDPLPPHVGQGSDTPEELFSQLEFAVSERGKPLFRASGDGSRAERTYTWETPLAPGEIREIEVQLSLAAATDARWARAHTQVQFALSGVSSNG